MDRNAALKLEAEEVTPKNALAVLAALGKTWTDAEARTYAARRVLALAKDGARKASGKAAAHVYTPDLSRVDDKATLKAFSAKVASVAATYTSPLEVAPAARKAPAVRKAHKVEAPKGGATVKF